MSEISNKKKVGVTAAIISGVAYGMNPLFARPLLDEGISVTTMLFFRYIFGMLGIALLMLIKRDSFRITKVQLPVLLRLGLYFSGSSGFLFWSYNMIPTGIATTLCFLTPVFIAISMIFLKDYPSWQTWLSIAVTLFGVAILCLPSGGFTLNSFGITLALLSAISYAIYLLIVNRSVRIKTLSPNAITFYALGFGSLLFAIIAACSGNPILEGVHGVKIWALFAGLGLIPTMVSLLTLAIALRFIGATEASILGVFEPLTAIMLGTILFAEPLTANIAFGAALCIFAVIFLIVSENRH